MELMPLNIAGKILLDLLKVNENLMGGKVSLTWTPLLHGAEEVRDALLVALQHHGRRQRVR